MYRFLPIAHLNAGVSNKCPCRLFLSYIKGPSIKSSLGSNCGRATNRANTVCIKLPKNYN